MTKNCDWCGVNVENEIFSGARLVVHKGHAELWCQRCVNEDATGGVKGSLKSKGSVVRRKDRPRYE